jgi:hypothetical protein
MPLYIHFRAAPYLAPWDRLDRTQTSPRTPSFRLGDYPFRPDPLDSPRPRLNPRPKGVNHTHFRDPSPLPPLEKQSTEKGTKHPRTSHTHASLPHRNKNINSPTIETHVPIHIPIHRHIPIPYRQASTHRLPVDPLITMQILLSYTNAYKHTGKARPPMDPVRVRMRRHIPGNHLAPMYRTRDVPTPTLEIPIPRQRGKPRHVERIHKGAQRSPEYFP